MERSTDISAGVPPDSGWTLNTLRMYFESRMVAQDRAVTAAMAAADRATTKAETAAERRFESVNEFRETLADQQRTLMPRAEADARMHALDEKLQLQQRIIEGLVAERKGVVGGWGYAVGVAGFIAMILALFRSGAIRTP